MTYAPSRHNILCPIPDSPDWILINPLSGNADLLSAEEAQALRDGKTADARALSSRGYLASPEEEQQRFQARYIEFVRNRDADEVQIFFVPTYACNFACGYCYQAPYDDAETRLSEPVIDAFFAWVESFFAGRRKYLTLFGGEPLLSGATHRAGIAHFLRRAADCGLDVAVVTNGHALKDYLPLLSQATIREIQVTLDGPAQVHDARRPLKGGGGTFSRIVEGIDAALAADMPVNLRTVLDPGNMHALAPLARFAIDKGWTAHPLFKTQLGRNYELHHCHAGADALFDRAAMVRAVAAEIKRHPHILAFHRPGFHGMRDLRDSGELPDPVYDACPACKTEWAADAAGRIYSCTATVGKPGEALGTFYPAVHLDEDAVFAWQNRDVLSISECRDCPVQLVCGGGCGALAKNGCGRIDGPDCRPVAELAGIGAALYGLTDFKDD